MAKRGQGEGTISKRSDGTWCARITVGKTPEGKQKRKAFYGKTRKEVQEKLTAAIADLNKGIYINPSKITVSEWMEIWLKEYRINAVKPKTYSNNECCIRVHIIPNIGDYALKDLKNEIIQRFVNDLSKQNRSDGRLELIYRTLKMGLDQAVSNEMLSKNPALNIKLPKSETREARVLTLEEQERIVREAPLHANGEIFILMLYTGLRIGEAAILTWDDIDFEEKMISVNKTQERQKITKDGEIRRQLSISTPKTKSSIRRVPMIPKLAKIMEFLKIQNEKNKLLLGEEFNPQNFVFCSPSGSMMDIGCFWGSLRRITNKLGIEGVHPHTLRHTFATRGAEQGIDLKVMQTLLGHASLNMTANIYTHVSDEQKQLNMAKLESLL